MGTRGPLPNAAATNRRRGYAGKRNRPRRRTAEPPAGPADLVAPGKPPAKASAAVPDYRRVVAEYVEGVRNRKIVAGRLVRAAVKRHLADLKTGKRRGVYFDEGAALYACRFFWLLKHSTGEFAGERFELSPWQAFIVWSLFGWKRADGTRRFRRAYVSIARKNGKSTFAAGLGLLLMIADREPRAEVYTIATRFKQATIIHSEAHRMVKSSPALRKHVEALRHNLNLPRNDSKYEPLGSDSDGLDGLNIHGALIDELHAWTKRHKELWEKIDTASGSRRQPLRLTITTAGTDKSEQWKIVDGYCTRVVLGEIEADEQFVFIAALDSRAELFDEAAWPKSNPNLGVSVRLDYLREQAGKAKNLPTEEQSFCRYHANLMVESIEKWITSALWKRGEHALSKLDGRRCFGGLDLGWRDDLASFYLVFPFDLEPVLVDGKPVRVCRYEVLGWNWAPRSGARDWTREPFAAFARDGLVALNDGDTTQVAPIYAKIRECRDRFDLRSVAFDGSNAREMGQNLQDAEGIPVFPFLQTKAKYNEPCREWAKVLKDGRLWHGGCKLLAWAVGNVVLERDTQDRVMPSKAKSADKIDPAVAALMAFSEALFDESQGPSPYATAGGGVVLF